MPTLHIEVDEETCHQAEYQAAIEGTDAAVVVARWVKERPCKQAEAPQSKSDESLETGSQRSERSEAGDSGPIPLSEVPEVLRRDPLWGLFADDPDSVDAMLEAAMEWRRERNRALSQQTPPFLDD